MIAAPVADLRARAEAVQARIPADGRARSRVADMTAAVGGGSLPGETLPSAGLAVDGRGAASVAERLRTGDPAVLTRVADGAVWLDLRTVAPDDDARLAGALGRVLTER
jgi:L-seryl-tRNA(Ser) seleniumtransferase